MSPEYPESIQSLYDALEVSPENIPLRTLLAETLLKHDFLEESEHEYRQALSQQPTNHKLMLGLVHVFLESEKYGEALVLLENLTEQDGAPALAYQQYATALQKTGDFGRAREIYKKALQMDSGSYDAGLEEALQFNPVTEDQNRMRARNDDGDDDIFVEVEKPMISFRDVGGMEKIKEDIRMKIIYPLQNPDVYKAYGKAIGGGILLYGPPGCGKTHMARATAGEVNAGFISVGINDVLDMWIGQSERNLHEIFDQARSNAPCVLFFDEVDALGASRTDMKKNAGRQLINQFLAELDGATYSNEGILILGATNAPWHLDSAFRRPGRFDKIVFVPPPDSEARVAILKILLKGKPGEKLDLTDIAKKARAFSGADLGALVDQAVELKISEAMRTGKPEPLVQKDLLKALKLQKPTTKEWFATARNYAMYSNQGGTYDDILDYLKLK